MKTLITATRLSGAIPGADYTVMVRTAGAGTVDVSLWLNDAEALELASQLRKAVTTETAIAKAETAE